MLSRSDRFPIAAQVLLHTLKLALAAKMADRRMTAPHGAGQPDQLIEQLTTVILAQKDMTVGTLGHYWKESILPAWKGQDYNAIFLQSIAGVFSDLRDTEIEADKLNYRVITMLRDCWEEGLSDSYDHVMVELLRKQVAAPRHAAQMTVLDAELAGVGAPGAARRPTTAPDDADLDMDSDSEPPRSARRRRGARHRRNLELRHLEEEKEEEQEAEEQEEAEESKDASGGRFLGRLRPDDPVW